MDNIIYKPATKNDEPLIKSLLAKNNLPYGDIKDYCLCSCKENKRTIFTDHNF